MSKAVIEVMKKHMTLEERRLFIKRCQQNNKNWPNIIEGIALIDLFWSDYSFPWRKYSEGRKWNEVKNRFTPEELSLTINLKEL